MRYSQNSLIKIGCLLSLVGACGNPGTANMGGPSTQPQAGSTPGGGAAGTPTTGNNGGSSAGTAGKAGGTAVGTGGTPANNTGGTPGSGGTAGTPATAGGSDAPAPGGSCEGAGPAKEGMCKGMSNGVYAMRMDFDVWYEDAINNPKLILPHRAPLTIYLKAEITGVCEDGTGGKALMRPCGTILPPLYTDAVNRVVQIQFPDPLWDAEGIPSFETTGSVTGFDPGSMLVVDQTTSLVGISLADKEGAWPEYTATASLDCGDGKTGEACFPDIDGDGKPGITATMKLDGTPPSPGYLDGWEYTPAPTVETDALTGDGASEAYTGLRTRLSGSGTIGADCKSGVGNATGQDFESRVYGCKTKAGADCSPAQSEFVDKNTPIFHVLKVDEAPPATWKYEGLNTEIDAKLNRAPSKGPTVASVRLGEPGQAVTCADIRAAAYPAAQ
jgi:hypothetical protein